MIVATLKKKIWNYKLNLHNGIVNNMIDYALGEEDDWRFYQELIKCHLNHKRLLKAHVEDDILIFLIVYEIQPYDCVKQFLKISKKNMKWLTAYYGCCCIKEKKEKMLKKPLNHILKVKSLMLKAQLEILMLFLK